MNQFKSGDRVVYSDGLHTMEGTVVRHGMQFVEVLVDGTNYPTLFSPQDLLLSEASIMDWVDEETKVDRMCKCDIIALMQQGCSCNGK